MERSFEQLQAQAQALIEQGKAKSDDDYEKNLTYISAGTLVLSLTFLEKVVKLDDAQAIWFLIISWILMAVTLGLNLISHQKSSRYAETTIADLPLAEREPAAFVANYLARNKKIRRINWITTITISAGMVCLIIFCSTNALKSKKTKMAEDRKVNTDSLEQKGRTISIPVSILNAAKEVQVVVSATNNDANSSQNQSSGSSQQKKD
ncbi:hypothetical protein L0663_05145 [Dyadobacter sp. CY107]|uniref:hypothetical protein n=1 Tax=Dyadobacter fanqingshengii TaxID=2906443 RepID=UPI001F30D851|nr:hypothetical protein [Dyadobacter fanqingshengii]MCF2502753.1 hypothetical protein [Dyadobacter fanqingshengii]